MFYEGFRLRSTEVDRGRPKSRECLGDLLVVLMDLEARGPLAFLSAFTHGRSLQLFYNYFTKFAGLQSIYNILLQISL